MYREEANDTHETLQEQNAALRAELEALARAPKIPWWVLRFDKAHDPSFAAVLTAVLLTAVLGGLGAGHAGAFIHHFHVQGAYLVFWIYVSNILLFAGPPALWVTASLRRSQGYRSEIDLLIQDILPRGWGVRRTTGGRYHVIDACGVFQGSGETILCAFKKALKELKDKEEG